MRLAQRVIRKIREDGFKPTASLAYERLQARAYTKLATTFPSYSLHVTPPLNGLFIEPTNFCNLHCKMCTSLTSKRERGYMNLGLYKKVIDELVTFRKPSLQLFFGGESLLHPRFLENGRVCYG